ncbi:hypothetical protein ACIRG5_09715 [Lentzea sp. NPDC102401]|uniref:hypothetical protein n=1 Tax=Lentzea sp. NPDC102401 TaxID=3364128 RepID=UPI0037FBC546
MRAFVAARVADRWPAQGVVRLSVPASEARAWTTELATALLRAADRFRRAAKF